MECWQPALPALPAACRASGTEQCKRRLQCWRPAHLDFAGVRLQQPVGEEGTQPAAGQGQQPEQRGGMRRIQVGWSISTLAEGLMC
jgi:hypothetical protein